MFIEIIAIGNEVLSGKTLNTNVFFLSKSLQTHGYSSHFHQTLPDAKQGLLQGLETAFERSHLIITCGGLGPTQDDCTRAIIAEFFGEKLVHRNEVEQHLLQIHKQDFPSLQNQCQQPEKADLFLNDVGTAPGFVLYKEERMLVVLPGVPLELHALWEKKVLPFCLEVLRKEKKISQRNFSFFKIRESEIDPIVRELSAVFPECEFGIYPDQGAVQVMVSSKEQISDEIERRLRECFGGFLYSDSLEGSLELTIKDLMVQSQVTLGCAESCTGGNLAARLVEVPGVSGFFEGSLVSYSNKVKKKCLGVQTSTLEQYGAVSEQTVKEMAQGVLTYLNTDYAIAVSGVAGPAGGTPDKPIGTVWIAVQKRGEQAMTERLQLKGNRSAIIKASGTIVFGKLWQKVKQNARDR